MNPIVPSYPHYPQGLGSVSSDECGRYRAFSFSDLEGLGIPGLGCRVQGLRGSRMVEPDIDTHSGERATHRRRLKLTFGTDIWYTSVKNAGE